MYTKMGGGTENKQGTRIRGEYLFETKIKTSQERCFQINDVGGRKEMPI